MTEWNQLEHLNTKYFEERLEEIWNQTIQDTEKKVESKLQYYVEGIGHSRVTHKTVKDNKTEQESKSSRRAIWLEGKFHIGRWNIKTTLEVSKAPQIDDICLTKNVHIQPAAGAAENIESN